MNEHERLNLQILDDLDAVPVKENRKQWLMEQLEKGNGSSIDVEDSDIEHVDEDEGHMIRTYIERNLEYQKDNERRNYLEKDYKEQYKAIKPIFSRRT